MVAMFIVAWAFFVVSDVARGGISPRGVVDAMLWALSFVSLYWLLSSVVGLVSCS